MTKRAGDEVVTLWKQTRESLSPTPRRSLRANVEKARAWQRRSRKRLPGESPKRQAERPEREAVRALTHERSGWTCAAAELVPTVACWGRLECDEIVSRGVNPGGHLDADNTQSMCSGHHAWRTAHPTEARQLGLRKTSTDPRSSLPERTQP